MPGCFSVHIEGYGDYTSYRDIVGTKAVAEDRAREAGWKVRDIRPGICSITCQRTNTRWALVVDYDGDWSGFGWSKETSYGAPVKPAAQYIETDLEDFDF